MKHAFSNYKVNCSQIYKIVKNAKGNTLPSEKDVLRYERLSEKMLSELKDNELSFIANHLTKINTYDKDKLSDKVKEEIRDLFIYYKYGRGHVYAYEGTPLLNIEKGNRCELDAINLLSKIDGINYVKNDKIFENKYFKGIPDIVVKDGKKVTKVIDIKVCLDLGSFFEKKFSSIDPEIYYQMQGYMNLTKCTESEVIYVLLNMPENILNDVKNRATLKWIKSEMSMTNIQRKIDELEKNMVYDDISIESRVYRQTVELDLDSVSKAELRVPLVRKYLKELDKDSPLIINGSKVFIYTQYSNSPL